MRISTDITFLLDRSGSMASKVTDVIGGWKAFVEKQKTEPGEAKVSLVQFDDQYETPFTAIPIENLSPIIVYSPRGWTALRDAIGRTINNVGERLRSLPASERPTKVVIIVMTDGEENASREFTQDQIKQMVKHQTDNYQWEFLFLGANIDSFAIGASYGVLGINTTNYSYTKGGMRAMFSTVSNYTSATRAGVALGSTLAECQAKNKAEELTNNLTKDAGLNTSGGTVISGMSVLTPPAGVGG